MGKGSDCYTWSCTGDTVSLIFSRSFFESYRYPLVNKSVRHVRIQGKRKPHSRYEKTPHTKYSLMYMVLLIVHFHKMYRSSSTHPTENHPFSWELRMKEYKLSLWLPRRSGGPDVIWTRESALDGKSIKLHRTVNAVSIDSAIHDGRLAGLDHRPSEVLVFCCRLKTLRQHRHESENSEKT